MTIYIWVMPYSSKWTILYNNEDVELIKTLK